MLAAVIILIVMLLVLLDAVFFPDTIANKLHMQKVSDFTLSPGAQPSKVKKSQNPPSTRRKVRGVLCCFCCPLQVAVYVPGTKGAPSFVRLYQYPVLGGPSAALANKSFFKADRVNMQWNKKGEAPPPPCPVSHFVFMENSCSHCQSHFL